MNIRTLRENAADKSYFVSVQSYIDFAKRFTEYIQTGIQAEIVSQNENNYVFFQYGSEASYCVTRPINKKIFLDCANLERKQDVFIYLLHNIKHKNNKYNPEDRKTINELIYTCQQSIGAALDAIPQREANKARKINGDLFETFIRLIIAELGIDVSSLTEQIPIPQSGNLSMSYQHDIVIKSNNLLKAIGSVKTSSKDRLDKIFLDKYLYNKLTQTDIPHFAIFLNDVQRQGKEGKYSINPTFLPGHFIGYSIALNPLDGVYYCDLRPNMKSNDYLHENIKSIDELLLNDIWKFIK